MNNYEKQLKNSWSINSSAWTESIRQEKIVSRKTVTNPAIIHTILSENPQTVLDMGCGEGWLARAISKKDVKVVGIDGSESLIKEATKLGGGDFFWLNYDQFVEDPTKVGRNFDVVVFNFSLLSEDIIGVLAACKNILKKSGKIIIQTLHPISVIQNESERYEDGWRIENFDGMGEGYEASMPWYFRTLASWIKEVQDAGLQIIDCYEPIDPTNGKPLSLILVAGHK